MNVTFMTKVRTVTPESEPMLVGKYYELPIPEAKEVKVDEVEPEEVETKVMRRGRRPSPKANEDAETK